MKKLLQSKGFGIKWLFGWPSHIPESDDGVELRANKGAMKALTIHSGDKLKDEFSQGLIFLWEIVDMYLLLIMFTGQETNYDWAVYSQDMTVGD